MDRHSTDDLNIDDLERLTGQPRRNIRFLISEQVVPEARSRGRWASYGPEHVQALSRYAEMKAAGIHSLDLIKERIQLASKGVGPLEIAPLEGVTVRIEASVLEGKGAEALAEAIGEAVRKAVAQRNEERS